LLLKLFERRGVVNRAAGLEVMNMDAHARAKPLRCPGFYRRQVCQRL